MGKDVIIACDFAEKTEVLDFLSAFTDRKPFIKIGMELFYAEGADIVRELKRRGHKIFLDLKLHDIPNTVKKTMRVLSALDIDMCNVHAGGTIAMMQAAKEGLTREDGTRPLLIAVTQLTSTDSNSLKKELLIDKPMDEVVACYAKNAEIAGLDGKNSRCLRKWFSDSNSRSALCGWRGRRSKACCNPRGCQSPRIGLHCCRSADYSRSGSGCCI